MNHIGGKKLVIEPLLRGGRQWKITEVEFAFANKSTKLRKEGEEHKFDTFEDAKKFIATFYDIERKPFRTTI